MSIQNKETEQIQHEKQAIKIKQASENIRSNDKIYLEYAA
jgi:hypothetical protein